MGDDAALREIGTGELHIVSYEFVNKLLEMFFDSRYFESIYKLKFEVYH